MATNYMGVPIEALRVRAGYLATDATHDAEIDVVFLTVIDTIENYLNRKLEQKEYTEQVVYQLTQGISLAAYPLVTVDTITTDTGTLLTGTLSLNHGLVFLDSVYAYKSLDIVYTGGYVVLPPTIIGVVLAAFTPAWNSISMNASSSGTIKSMSVPDVGLVSFFDPNSVTGETSYGYLSGSQIALLDSYKRHVC